MRISRRISTALLNSLGSGVVPRVGLEYVAVGRKPEITAMLEDIQNVSDGAGAFRFVVGRYGSGKSFLLQLIRNHAMERDFVVADADLSPERRLAGSQGQGLATYRELLTNLSTKTRPDGGALPSVLERWISTIKAAVLKDSGIRPDDPRFGDQVEVRIMEVVNNLEGMVHGFDFGSVVAAYWRGNRQQDDALKGSALRWLRGEFSTKTEARQALGVRVIIDDDSWYDYLKLLARLVTSIGYKGLLLLVDEGVNLYKITNTASRSANYEKLLAMYNDTMQGKASSLGIVMAGTPQFVEDPRRGLYSYEALRSRLAESRFAQGSFVNMAGPVIQLQTLSFEEIFVLLTRLRQIHALHFEYEEKVKDEELQSFMQEVVNRLGAQDFLTPREVVKDFIAVLNILRQNPQITLDQVVRTGDFKPSTPGPDPDVEPGSGFAEFKL
jgi:hypothetical protein